MTERATTKAEANAQQLTLPPFEHWRAFAGKMDGYKIAQELGLDYAKWIEQNLKQWRETGQWDLDVMGLRLMLFYAYRSDYMSGYTYTENDELADSLLSAISEKLHLPYTPKQP
jgi:hypothetical protein